MPNDSTHRIINYLMLSVFIFLNFHLNLENSYIVIATFVGSYILFTEIFSPDLDTKSKPGKRLGILSYPIRKLSTHRGLGHNILIGWILKIIYIVLIGTVMLIATDKFGYNLYWTLNYIDEKTISAFLIGAFLSNAVHIITDKVI